MHGGLEGRNGYIWSVGLFLESAGHYYRDTPSLSTLLQSLLTRSSRGGRSESDDYLSTNIAIEPTVELTSGSRQVMSVP